MSDKSSLAAKIAERDAAKDAKAKKANLLKAELDGLLKVGVCVHDVGHATFVRR